MYRKTYAVKIADGAAKFLETLNARRREQVAKKLRGSQYYRVRSGDYRIIFEIEGKKLIVLVVAIGDRKDIYKRLKRLLK